MTSYKGDQSNGAKPKYRLTSNLFNDEFHLDCRNVRHWLLGLPPLLQDHSVNFSFRIQNVYFN